MGGRNLRYGILVFGGFLAFRNLPPSLSLSKRVFFLSLFFLVFFSFCDCFVCYIFFCFFFFVFFSFFFLFFVFCFCFFVFLFFFQTERWGFEPGALTEKAKFSEFFRDLFFIVFQMLFFHSFSSFLV